MFTFCGMNVREIERVERRGEDRKVTRLKRSRLEIGSEFLFFSFTKYQEFSVGSLICLHLPA